MGEDLQVADSQDEFNNIEDIKYNYSLEELNQSAGINHNRKIFLEKLREYGIKVMSIDISGYSDIGEMPQEVVEQRKQNADIVSDLDYLHYKLDF